MIVPMTKYSFLLYRDDLTGFLDRLQDAGMIHVESENVEPDEETSELMRKLRLCEKILDELKSIKPGNDATPFAGNADAMLNEYAAIAENKNRMETLIKKTEQDAVDAEPWGSFDRRDLKRLDEMNVRVRYCAADVKRLRDERTEKYPLSEIAKIGNKVYFVVLQDDPNADFDFADAEIKPPTAPHSDLLAELKRLKEELRECSLARESLALSAQTLSDECGTLKNKIDFRLAELSAGSEAEGCVKLLTGWLPNDKTEAFNRMAETMNTAYLADANPDKDDSPPILLKNNRFAKLFEPLTSLYSLPNYGELDPTAFIAPFFMMFFGFCLGDGGYGLMILLGASLAKLKIKTPAIRSYLSLAQLLGAATLLFGFVTATFWGFEFAQIKLDKAAEKFLGLPDNYGMLCLSLACGYIQIIFGMCVKVAKIVHQKGLKYAVSEIGWIAVIVGGTVAVASPAPSAAHDAALAVFAAGAFAALFCNSPGKNPLVNLGTGIWTTYNTVSGLLGDILSYIRLFALGMTGGILGNVFNTLALDAGEGVGIPVAAQLVTLFVLLLGHGLNFMLGALGAMIHPMRLTFVEFYKSAGFEGGGSPFKPFGKNKQEINRSEIKN